MPRREAARLIGREPARPRSAEFVPLRDDIPVDDAPQGLEVVGAAVLVVEVVGVLPDVEGQEGLQAADDGIEGAGLLGDVQGAGLVGAQPHPAGPEEPGALGLEFGLECLERAPLLRDLRGQRAGRALRACPGRAELRKVHVVVQDLAGVVENGRGRPCRTGRLDRRGREHNLLKWQALKAGAGNQSVQVGYISGKVLAVVEFQRTGADHRLQRIQRIGQVNQCKHMLKRLYTSIPPPLPPSGR